MPRADSRLAVEEIGDRGEALYERSIRSKVEDEYFGHYLAIDVLSGDYEVGGRYTDVDARLQTAKTLLQRKPNAEVYLKLIGYSATAAIGGVLKPIRKQ